MGTDSCHQRVFGFMSSLGLMTTVMATWEAYTVIFQIVVYNGGPVRTMAVALAR